jgi:hypothetical protein
MKFHGRTIALERVELHGLRSRAKISVGAVPPLFGAGSRRARPRVSPLDASGAKVGHDLDGTPNDPRDDDEEWVIEMVTPFASIGLRGVPGERIGFSARRCGAPKGATRRCAAWGEPGGEIVLQP